MALQIYPPTRGKKPEQSGDLDTVEPCNAPKPAAPEDPLETENKGEVTINQNALLGLCNDVRTSLQEDACLGPRGDVLMRLLGAVIKSEYDEAPILDLRLIRATHLDKLLADIHDKTRHLEHMSPDLRACLSIADSLQRHWRMRLRDGYLGLDNSRYYGLTQRNGRLDNVYFDDAKCGEACQWAAKGGEALSEVEGNTEIKEGHWWLNLACAQRDGIVCCSSEAVSKGRYGIATMPLLTGTEIAQWPAGTTKYVREGTLRDMCVALISQVGTRIRVLRGHLLKSPFAPRGGLRYDGQYIIRRYGQSRNQLTGVFRLSIDLERVGGQKPMHEICLSPRPSDMDDWHLFEKLESDILRKKWDDERYLEWKRERAQKKADQEQFQEMVQLESMKIIQKMRDEDILDSENMEELKFVHKIADLKWER
ncbi:unnamed protein product [Clonostachys rosea f. rosea IK726]|uniref:Uncharacterized protein n=1 Tax=Clonostachys rosea f. rosea IK726 TaxID=1349383 RepID=A0ACA9T9V2_BIOOC|nr:unnamed protein product [Clonostachys rosea f. rosea IK726]